MRESFLLQGRPITPLALQQLRQWREDHPDWSRWRFSRELTAHWGWRNGAGQLKDLAARTLLVKLAQRGLIDLPPRRQAPPNRITAI